MNSCGYTEKFTHNLLASLGRRLIHSYDLYEEDLDWHAFAWKLKQQHQVIYEPQDVFVVQHYDLEYFVSGFGFSIYNFNAMIQHLDIDPCRFVIVTNHFGSTSQWQSYCAHPENQFQVIETPMTGLLCQGRRQAQLPLNLNCRYRMLCLMSTARNHREALARFFLQRDAVTENLISFRNFSPGAQHVKTIETATPHYPGVEFLEPVPWSRLNERWQHSGSVLELEQKWPTIPSWTCPHVPERDLTGTSMNPWYQDIFVDIVAESVYNHPYGYISEKTMRPIICGRPMIVVGAPGTLAYLRALGFKTFSTWWDESYDNESDPNRRLQKIFDLMDEILCWPLWRCRYILAEMHDSLIHNQRRYLELTEDYDAA